MLRVLGKDVPCHAEEPSLLIGHAYLELERDKKSKYWKFSNEVAILFILQNLKDMQLEDSGKLFQNGLVKELHSPKTTHSYNGI